MTESYNRDLLLLELGDLNAKINALMAERKTLIARIEKPAHITITARTPQQEQELEIMRSRGEL